MQIWAESGKSALPICNYSQILYQFLTFTQNLKRSHNFESSPFSAAIMVVSYIHALGMQDSETQYDEFLHKYEIIFNYPEENDASNEVQNYIDDLTSIIEKYL